MSDEDAGAPEFERGVFRPRPAFDFERIRDLVTSHFKVYEVEQDVRGVAGSEIAAFYVQVDPAQFAQKFEALREAIRLVDPNLVVILQYRTGEDVILVARKPPVIDRGAGLNLLLLILTTLTTTLAGAIFYAGYEQAEGLLSWGSVDLTYLHPLYLALGFLSFSLPVMLILGIHELGHYFVAKRHHVRTSLPYFIPVPPVVPIGTFGAFISIRDPIPDRRALFDIGASGPIAGFLAALPILAVGLLLTGIVAAPIPIEPELHAELRAPNGTTWGDGHANADADYANETRERNRATEYLERISANRSSGNFSAGTWTFSVRASDLDAPTKVTMRVTYAAPANESHESLFTTSGDGNFTVVLLDRELSPENATESVFLFQLPENATAVLAEFTWQKPPASVMGLGTSLLFQGANLLIPTPPNVLIHPTGFAGWVGLLVTGFNLLPAGQLDGGHVARAVLGEKMKYASYASVIGMTILGFYFTGWFIMAILIVFLGVRHPPPLNDKTPLDPRRKVLAALVLVILVVSFIPIPFLTN